MDRTLYFYGALDVLTQLNGQYASIVMGLKTESIDAIDAYNLLQNIKQILLDVGANLSSLYSHIAQTRKDLLADICILIETLEKDKNISKKISNYQEMRKDKIEQLKRDKSTTYYL